MGTGNDLEELIREAVGEELGRVQGRVRTLEFVNRVINRLREYGVELSVEDEARLRPRVVDVLWSLRKGGRLSFDDDLLHFVVTGQEGQG